MKLEAGKKYKNRNGEVKGPLEKSEVSFRQYPFFDNLGDTWTSGGGYHKPHPWHPKDLIEEVKDEEQPTKETKMKLEEGKYYVTRDGRKVGPVESYESFRNQPPVNIWKSDGLLWSAAGISYDNRNPEEDIVSEWKDEPLKKEEPTLSGETVDRIAIDSLKWHYKDKDMEPLQQEAFRIVLRYYGVAL